jgi:site-specific DNA-methyltransferase (adenine-specific)
MSIAKFKPASHNANRHTARGLKALTDSMRSVGYTEPMVAAADGEMLSGSARLETVADVFGVDVEPLVIHSDGRRPVIHIRDDIPNAQTPEAVKIALTANRVAQLDLDWDVEMLASLDADAIGDLWTPAELSDLGQQWADEHAEPVVDDPGPQIDKADELQEKWNVAPGELWQAGPHKIICGDCREPATWARLLSSVKANGVFTSPPYAEQRKAQYGGTPAAEYVAWWDAVQANGRANLASDGSFFVNIKPHCEDGERVLYVFDLVLAMQRQWGWRFVDELCWTHQGIMGRWDERLKNQFEPIYQFVIGKSAVRHANVIEDFKRQEFAGYGVYDGVDNHVPDTGSPFRQQHKRSAEFDGALPGNVLRIGIGGGGIVPGQSAQFPVALPDFFIRAYSDAGDLWVDPFCGSGTTIVAAHNNKRIGLGIEQLPRYCSVILERLSGLGLTPVKL